MYRILSYTRIKPRSRHPQKNIRIFYAPRFFSGQNKKKCANYASKYGNWREDEDEDVSSNWMILRKREGTVN